MHTMKICKIGNSMGVVIPKDVLAIMEVSEGDSLHITRAPDGSFRITPYDEEFSKQMAAAEEIMQEDRDLLRELAKR